MKKLAMALTVLAVTFPVAALGGQEGYFSGSYARLNYVQGEVVIQRAVDLGYEQGQVNLVIAEGDKLATQKGRAEIHFGRNNYLRLNDNSQVEFADLPQNSGDIVKLHILSGDVFLRISNLEREKDFEIHTPDASFYILEEGLYRFHVRENKETELCVERGSAEAAAEEGSVLVREGEQIFASNGTLGTHTSLSSAEDDFSRWNETRDVLYSSNSSRRYLPSEIGEYENELSDNGRWVYERPYGYVWVPVVSYSDWRPYYYGHWVWYPIIGWTWISDEPWGWAVYHYGRWHWRLGLGWYWIPTVHWGPAWVHWFHGHDYYGWCPMSYYNRPVVLVDNYFHDRHYGDDYPLHSRALTVIHRNQLQARRISSVALNQTQIRSLSRVTLKATSSQADIRPAIRQSVNGIGSASKVFSGSQIRKVTGNYAGRGNAVSPSGLRSPGTSITRTDRGNSGSGTASTPSRGIIQRKSLSPGDASNGRAPSSSPLSTRKITPFPSTRSGERSSGSSIIKPGGAITSRNIKSTSGSSFRSDVSPSRTKIKSYTPLERSGSSLKPAASPSRERVISYPSSSRITQKKGSGSDSYSPFSSRSFDSGRSSGYIRGDSGYIRSRFRNDAPSPSSSRPERSLSRSYSAPQFSPAPSRSLSHSSSPSPRISAPSLRSAPPSSGSVSRPHSGSSSGPSTSSHSSSGRITKRN